MVFFGHAIGLEHFQRLGSAELMALEHGDADRMLFRLDLLERLETERFDSHGLRRARLTKRRQHAKIIFLGGRAGAFVGHAGKRVFENGNIGLRIVKAFDVGPATARYHRR